MTTSVMLTVAIDAARSAARVALERFDRPQIVTHKGFRDIVTEADIAAQNAAVAMILARFPEAAILGEEDLAPSTRADTVWVIDPIDGTTNYARQFPTFAVSIGVTQRGQPVAGAVYDPLRNHLFEAEAGRGATLNGAPIHVSEVQALPEAILAFDWGRSPEDRRRALTLVHAIVSECRTARAIGSAALAMCYLAAGWVDLFFNLVLKPWDGAAAQLIIAEAGGRMTNLQGETWDYTQPAAFASNGYLHFVFDRYRVRE